LFSIIQADNGDVITVGGIDGGNFGVMRLNGDGEPVWQRDYFRGRGEAIIELKGGEFLTCGNREGKGYAMMMSADGDIIWQHEYGPDSTASFLTEMRETDGGVVIVGHVNNRYANGLIIKVNIENGDVIWTQQYELRNPSRSLYFYSIVSGENRATIHGAELPAGIYLLRLDTGSAVRSMKVVLLK
jgi:hypothetical protein